MEKAYDLKELVNKVKAKGLPMLEDGAEKLLEAVFEWLDESAVVSKGKIDDMFRPVYPLIQEQVKKQVDKIDPSDNE